MNSKRTAVNEADGVAKRITPSYRPAQVEKTPPCQVGCANCGDIRGWIGTVAQRDKLGLSRNEAYARAWRVIAAVNPFPATLGRICPHPCENQCNRADLDEPLAINAMERFLGDFGVMNDLPLPLLPGTEATEWIGVVGAGPSGLSFAYQMARRGYRVTVYDEHEQAGGMLRYGVPDYRLPQNVLDVEIRKILDVGVEMELGTRVGVDIDLQALRQRHDSLYLGIGAQKGLGLPVPGGEGESVWVGTEYLARVNRGEAVDPGRRVVVVGGGNTAVDAARCARRAGAEVQILYRRGRDEMPATAHEIEEALAEGVELEILAAPVRVERDEEGRLRGVEVQRMTLGAPDASGRRRPEPLEDSGYFLPADSVIAAISQVPVLDGLESLDHDGSWLLAGVAGQLEEGVQAGGDAVRSGIAGEAIFQGRRAAETLHARLRGGEVRVPEAPTLPEILSDRVRLATKETKVAPRMPELPVDERLAAGMVEVTATITESQFLKEAERCFSCGTCSGCEQCFMYCTSNCFTRLEEPRPGMYFMLNLDQCRECGKCIEVCPGGFLEAGAASG